MKALTRRLSAIAMTAAMLSGCVSSQAGGPIPMGATGSQARAQKMAGSSGDLLYVSDGKNDVRVFTFPQGELIQTLTNVGFPGSQCSDQNGNVFISNRGEPGSLVEFAHGGSTIIGVLTLNNLDSAGSCTVDSTTGNVAAAAVGGVEANISIFPAGQGTPTEYEDPTIREYISCAYDKNGNLYIDGEDAFGDFVLAVMPKGSGEFTNIPLDTKIDNGVGLQWNRRYLMISAETADGVLLNSVKIIGSSGRVVNAIPLDRSLGAFGLVQGHAIVAVYQTTRRGHRKYQDRAIGLWTYPTGGRPTSIISRGHFSTISNITGFSISVAPSGSHIRQ